MDNVYATKKARPAFLTTFCKRESLDLGNRIGSHPTSARRMVLTLAHTQMFQTQFTTPGTRIVAHLTDRNPEAINLFADAVPESSERMGSP